MCLPHMKQGVRTYKKKITGKKSPDNINAKSHTAAEVRTLMDTHSHTQTHTVDQSHMY